MKKSRCRADMKADHGGRRDGVQAGLILPPIGERRRRSHARDDISARPARL
jgi:hypothetical protein